MRQLPAGTVTFLFTDIEGSTRLLDELGSERYAEVLAEHRRILRAAVAEHRGFEVDTEGDAFFVVFERASDAVSAALAAQQGLHGGPVRVRMGLHTGEPLVAENNYVGIDVHRAARVMAAGHGGQILLTEQTARLVDGVELRDLGPQRLKDLTAAVRLFQAGSGQYPPLKTLHGTNLPVQPMPLIGRERELATTAGLLREHRLVTLTGAGGSGKTRLALQVAAEAVEEYPDGVWWVPLAAVGDPELVLPTIAHTLGAKNGLAAHVGDRRILLLLDNLEHLLECAAGLAEVIANTLHARMLVTSREALHVAGERAYEVEPLVEAAAVALFRERAAIAEPLATVREICHRLDCLPLALELAAARTTLLTPEQLLERLQQRLPLLTRGARDAPERQRTLRATIEWSHDLLLADEQRLFARLAVFAGSFDLEAAESICEADLEVLHSLVDKSLVRRWGSGRLGMLETIGEFARERLEDSGEAEDLRRRHAEYFVALAERAEQNIPDADQRAWLERLDPEIENFRTVLAWSLGGREPEHGLRLYSALQYFWFDRDYQHVDGRLWLEHVTRRAEEVPQPLRARALSHAGVVAIFTNDDETASRLLERALELAREVEAKDVVAHALLFLGGLARSRDELETSIELTEEALSLYRELGDDYWTSGALHQLAERHRDAGEFALAATLFEESLAYSRRNRPLDAAQTVHSLADLALDQRDFARAGELYRESLDRAREFDTERLACYCLAGLASVAAEVGAGAKAARLWGAVEALEERLGVRMIAVERARYERLVEAVCREHQDSLDEGRRASLDEILAEASV